MVGHSTPFDILAENLKWLRLVDLEVIAHQKYLFRVSWQVEAYLNCRAEL